MPINLLLFLSLQCPLSPQANIYSINCVRVYSACDHFLHSPVIKGCKVSIVDSHFLLIHLNKYHKYVCITEIQNILIFYEIARPATCFRLISSFGFLLLYSLCYFTWQKKKYVSMIRACVINDNLT